MTIQLSGETLSPETARHIPKFGGEIWYVNKGNGDDTNVGRRPDAAFETIGAAITACSAGDAINIKAGTYTETGLDVNKTAMELWFEIGAIIAPATGTALTLSADFCKLQGLHRITPPAGEVGLLISGDYAYVEHGTILTGGTAVRITGAGGIVIDYAAGLQTAVAYDIQGAQTRLTDCKTVGNTTTIGYWINSGASIGVLSSCTSKGHQTSGFQIDTGSTSWTVFNCSSGVGDGRWIDADDVNVWSNFTFDADVSKTLTFNASGATSSDLYRVYGSVLITECSGHVSTTLAGDIGNGYLELYDGTNQIDLTDSPGPSFNSLATHSYIHKIDDAGVAIAIQNASQVRLYEDSTKFGIDPNFQITAKNGAATCIKFRYSGSGASGVIHWHCVWKPLTEDGSVSAA